MKFSDIRSASDGLVRARHSIRGKSDPQIADAQLILLNLHDGDEHSVPKNIQHLFHGKQDELQNYVHVERDVGINELGTNMLRDIDNSLLLEVMPPRSIIDANRVAEHFLAMELPAEKHDELRRMHGTIQDTIRMVLDGTPNARVVFDLHSMSPKGPRESIPTPTPDSLRNHVELWKEAAISGLERPVDIIDALTTGEIIGNRPLAEDLGNLFGSLGHPWAFNAPYAKSAAHHPIDFVSGHGKKGISIDLPKDLLTLNTPGVPFDLSSCMPDIEKISQLSKAISAVLKKHL